MNNYVKPGDRITFTASADRASGAAQIVGTLLVVSCGTLANGATGEGATEGVFTLPKLSTAVVAQGVRLTWDVSAGEFIIASAAVGDLENCAIAESASGNGATTVRAKLAPGCGTIKAS